jgi:hypothetical protein
MKSKARVAIVLLIACVAYAQHSIDPASPRDLVVWEPPAFAWPADYPRATVPKEIVKEIKVGGWSITLEETELLAAQRHFGGTIGNRGDASEALGWLCLYRRDRSSSWVLWLESGEIDGPTIGSFTWQRLPSGTTIDRRCRLLAGTNATVVLPGSLRLGMTEKEVLSRLGESSARSGNTAIYVHEHDLTISNRPYTLENCVVINFRNGTVWAIDGIHVTTS